jgi:hypothetical protein
MTGEGQEDDEVRSESATTTTKQIEKESSQSIFSLLTEAGPNTK